MSGGDGGFREKASLTGKCRLIPFPASEPRATIVVAAKVRVREDNAKLGPVLVDARSRRCGRPASAWSSAGSPGLDDLCLRQPEDGVQSRRDHARHEECRAAQAAVVDRPG